MEHAAAGASGSVASLIQATRNEIRKNGKRNRRGCLLFRIFFDASIVHTHTSGKDRQQTIQPLSSCSPPVPVADCIAFG